MQVDNEQIVKDALFIREVEPLHKTKQIYFYIYFSLLGLKDFELNSSKKLLPNSTSAGFPLNTAPRCHMFPRWTMDMHHLQKKADSSDHVTFWPW